jgi:hypothetical protein
MYETNDAQPVTSSQRGPVDKFAHMPDSEFNLYYYPEKSGLRIFIHEFTNTASGVYEFLILERIKDKALFWVTDNAGSNHVPFDVTKIADLKPITNETWADFTEAVKNYKAITSARADEMIEDASRHLHAQNEKTQGQ